MKDLTEGKAWGLLWRFTLPLLISILFQQMYNLADTFIAGKYIGDTPAEGILAIAAVGVSRPVVMLFIQIANGINGGCAVVISQLFGAKSYVKLKTAASTAIIATVAASLLLTVIGLSVCRPLLRLLDTGDDIFKDASIYLNIYIAGLAFLFLYNVCNGIFTAMGDSKTPLYFLMASSVGNVVLNIILVVPFGMGIAGIAWATFIAQGISALLSVAVLYFRIRNLETRHKGPRFSTSMLKTIGKIALPTIAQLSCVSVGGLFVQRLVNGMGEEITAGYTTALGVSILAVNCMFCPASAFSAYSAQNIGAGKHERIPQGFKAGYVLSAAVVLPFIILFAFFPDFVLGLFVKDGKPTQTMLEVGRLFLQINSPFYLVLAIKVLCDGVLRGAGALKPFVMATFTDLFLRVALSYILVPRIGFIGLSVGWTFGWVVSSFMVLFFYKKGVWRNTEFSRSIAKKRA